MRSNGFGHVPPRIQRARAAPRPAPPRAPTTLHRPMAIEPGLRITQRTEFAFTEGAYVSWRTAFAVVGPGNKEGAIVQELTRTFGRGTRAGQNPIAAPQHFYELFPVSPLGRAAHLDIFSTDLARQPEHAATDYANYCLLRGALYFVGVGHRDFQALVGLFRPNAHGVPREIDMPACADVGPGGRRVIGRQLAYRDLFFCHSERRRTTVVRISNTTEGPVPVKRIG